MADVEQAIEEIMEQVQEVGDNTRRFTQEESAEFYEGVASDCQTRARTIRSEIG